MKRIAVLIRQITIALLLLCGVGSAFAYPATSSRTYTIGGVSGGPWSTPEAACIAASNTGLGAGYAKPWCSQEDGTNPNGSTYGHCKTPDTAPCNFNTSVNWSSSIPSYTCPNGGTLSGSTCTCAAGETDTGSACTAPACPAGQFKRSSGASCEAACPAGQANGPADYPPQGKLSGFCMDRQDFVVGLGWTDVSSTTTVPRCQYAGSGITVCADGGSGVSCYSEYTYGTGQSCSTESHIPGPTPTTCDVGDLWCKSTGSCGSGFVQGTFNGESLCIKVGETVTVTPRDSSGLDPTKDASIPDPPTSLAGGSSGGTATIDPEDQIVVAVGPGANTVASSGGTGTGGGVDLPTDYQRDATGQLTNTKLQSLIDDGLKVDETGMPSGAGAFDAAGTALDAAKGEAITGLGTVTSSTGKSTSWTFSLSLPTTCSPLNVNMIYETVVLDPCEYIDVMHDLMSMIWAASTLFLTVGMVGRTLREA